MLKKQLIFTVIILFCRVAFAIDIVVPTHVIVKFTTSINIVSVAAFNEKVGAVEMAFDMKNELYEPMDNLPEPVTGLNVSSIKISAPSLSGQENFTASIRMAYRKTIQDSAVPLYSANNLPASTFKQGAPLTNEHGITEFNNTILADITNANSPRVFNNVLFVIKVRFDGPDASSVDLNELNLQLELTADVETIVKNP